MTEIRQNRVEISDDALQAAAIWHQRLKAPTMDLRQWEAFTQWLENSPENRLAYEQIESLYDDLDLAGDQTADLPPERPSANRLRTWGPALGAALLAASVAIVLLRPEPSPLSAPAQIYQTAIGEIRTETLPDGSTITLNSGSAVSLRFLPQQREIDLTRGEVLFHVAHDPARPFVVSAGDQQIKDIGTIFAVERGDKATAISVFEGKVSVTQPGGRQDLVAGDRYVKGQASAVELIHGESEVPPSWVNGTLVYDDAPLPQVIRDLNRYVPQKIELRGDEAAAQRFSGVLQIDTEEVMLNRLIQFLPLTIERTKDGPVTLQFAKQRKQ